MYELELSKERVGEWVRSAIVSPRVGHPHIRSRVVARLLDLAAARDTGRESGLLARGGEAGAANVGGSRLSIEASAEARARRVDGGRETHDSVVASLPRTP
eukprot:5717399-Prymnesium_polylepis.1